MRIHRLGRVFKRVRGKVFPVLDHGLVFEQLQRRGGRWSERVASVRARAVNRKRRSRKGAGRYLVNVLSSPDELFHRPFGQHAKFGRDETDLARTAPYDGWRAAVRDEFFEFLCGASHHVSWRKKKKPYEQGALETPFDKHFVFVCHGHL